jgi:hypothetical protein
LLKKGTKFDWSRELSLSSTFALSFKIRFDHISKENDQTNLHEIYGSASLEIKEKNLFKLF